MLDTDCINLFWSCHCYGGTTLHNNGGFQDSFDIALILEPSGAPCGCGLQHTLLLGKVNGCMVHFVVECLLSITLSFKRAICKIWPNFS